MNVTGWGWSEPGDGPEEFGTMNNLTSLAVNETLVYGTMQQCDPTVAATEKNTIMINTTTMSLVVSSNTSSTWNGTENKRGESPGTLYFPARCVYVLGYATPLDMADFLGGGGSSTTLQS